MDVRQSVRLGDAIEELQAYVRDRDVNFSLICASTTDHAYIWVATLGAIGRGETLHGKGRDLDQVVRDLLGLARQVHG